MMMMKIVKQKQLVLGGMLFISCDAMKEDAPPSYLDAVILAAKLPVNGRWLEKNPGTGNGSTCVCCPSEDARTGYCKTGLGSPKNWGTCYFGDPKNWVASKDPRFWKSRHDRTCGQTCPDHVVRFERQLEPAAPSQYLYDKICLKCFHAESEKWNFVSKDHYVQAKAEFVPDKAKEGNWVHMVNILDKISEEDLVGDAAVALKKRLIEVGMSKFYNANLLKILLGQLSKIQERSFLFAKKHVNLRIKKLFQVMMLQDHVKPACCPNPEDATREQRLAIYKSEEWYYNKVGAGTQDTVGPVTLDEIKRVASREHLFGVWNAEYHGGEWLTKESMESFKIRGGHGTPESFDKLLAYVNRTLCGAAQATKIRRRLLRSEAAGVAL